MSLKLKEQHALAEKTRKRQKMELEDILKRLTRLRSGIYSRNYNYMQIEFNSGTLKNIYGDIISDWRFIEDPHQHVQLLAPDTNSPFVIENGRILLTHWGYLQNGFEANYNSTRFTHSSHYPPESGNDIFSKDLQARQFKKFIEYANYMADRGYLVTWTGAEGEMSSILYPLHIQCLKLKEGIVLNNYFDYEQYLSLDDLPEFISKANEQNLMLNFRFLGNRKVLVLGFYPHGYTDGELPILPDLSTVNKETANTILTTYIIRAGMVEACTNALAPNKIATRYLRRYLKLDISDDPDYIRKHIQKIYHQFDAVNFLKPETTTSTCLKSIQF